MFEIAFDPAWLAGKDFPRERGRALLRLLDALSRSASLREAAGAADLSYRNAWGVLGEAARLFAEKCTEPDVTVAVTLSGALTYRKVIGRSGGGARSTCTSRRRPNAVCSRHA